MHENKGKGYWPPLPGTIVDKRKRHTPYGLSTLNKITKRTRRYLAFFSMPGFKIKATTHIPT